MSSKLQSVVIVYSVILFSSPLLFFSCKQKLPPANAVINNVFENIPPVAEDITVKILAKPGDAGNVLLTARFDTKIVKDKFHAVIVNDEKLVLRDDGEGGDEKAGDAVFSILLKEDIARFRRELVNIQKNIRRFLAEKRNLFKWVNRSAVSMNELVKKFESVNFDTATIIKIDRDILFVKIPDPVLNDRSLMITDLKVVEDPTRTFNPCTGAGNPNGSWTFGKLMTDMANTPATGVSAQNFAKAWLDKWMNVQTVNGDIIAARINIFNRLIVPWIIKSNPGIPPASITIANWKTKTIQLKFAPFRLLAIVNRVDLRGNSGYGISNAGEGRFVFGALGSNCLPLNAPGKFTVIFEYAVPKNTCATLNTYAQQWMDLKTKVPGSAAYNNALQAITDQFAAAGAGGNKPNGSSLNQLRTNELAIGNPWELREFKINAVSHTFTEVTVAQEPAKIFNRRAFPAASLANQTILAKYVNTNEGDILNNSYTVPASFSGVNFLGGKAHTETPGHFWDASVTTGPAFITNNNARHIFSLNTCSGCHGGEGKTTIGNLINDPAGVFHNAFLQIAPQPFGVKATLAAFLTGDPSQADGLFRVTDPAGRPTGSPTIWTFNDLARRNIDLQELVEQSCKNRLIDFVRVLKFIPVRMSH
ncbi:MAG: hypothetical protein H7Z13_11295 [Ferruginibacter sp.]|nr:hypothetical protein [Ferruginibacter sp.]